VPLRVPTTRPTASRAAVDTPNPSVRRARLKRPQRERLIEAMIELAAKSGFKRVSIAQVCSLARVSPATFYEKFESKEDCCLAAYRHCVELIRGGTGTLMSEGAGRSEAARHALSMVLDGVSEHPDAGRVLFIEAPGGDSLVRDEHDRLLFQFERGIERLLGLAPASGQRVDIPPIAVTGALRHVVSRHLLALSEDRLPLLLEEGLAWLSSYTAPHQTAPWSTSRAALLEATREPRRHVTWAPMRLPPGRHGLSRGAVARSQRTRLMNATAQVMLANGYADGEIRDMVAAARVSKPTFYHHFADKEDAFLATYNHGTQCTFERLVQAYFSADQWPARVWRCLHTLIALIVQNPAMAHLLLVERDSAGQEAIRQAEAFTRSCTFFLQEGYQHREDAALLPRRACQATVGAIFEIMRRCVAEANFAGLAGRLPQLAYIALTPSTGAWDAIALVEGMRARQVADAGSRGTQR
jgi:AcrR family transcriptional regulator